MEHFQLNKMRKRHNITREFLLQEYFQKRRTQKDIALELGCHVGTVEAAMSRHGLTNQVLSRYKVKEELMVPTNPYFIYAVGLFITDGSIAKDGRLSIRINDKDPIKVLTDYFDCPYYHCRRDTRPQHEFNIPYNTPLTDYCRGLTSTSSRKTFEVRVPTDIQDESLRLLLLRGIIDGDGSIRPDSTDIRVFTASKAMADTLGILLESLSIDFTTIASTYGKYKKEGWTIRITTESTVPTLIRVYQDYPELAVQRKRNVARAKVYDIVRTYGMINHKKW